MAASVAGDLDASQSFQKRVSVSNRVLDGPVAEVVLDRPRVMAVIGKFKAASVAEHVRMHAEWHLRGLAEPLKHPAEADGAHGRSPLA